MRNRAQPKQGALQSPRGILWGCSTGHAFLGLWNSTKSSATVGLLSDLSGVDFFNTIIITSTRNTLCALVACTLLFLFAFAFHWFFRASAALAIHLQLCGLQPSLRLFWRAPRFQEQGLLVQGITFSLHSRHSLYACKRGNHCSASCPGKSCPSWCASASEQELYCLGQGMQGGEGGQKQKNASSALCIIFALFGYTCVATGDSIQGQNLSPWCPWH